MIHFFISQNIGRGWVNIKYPAPIPSFNDDNNTICILWDGTWDELVEFTKDPGKFIDWALINIEREHRDAIDSLLADGNEELYVNQKLIPISSIS